MQEMPSIMFVLLLASTVATDMAKDLKLTDGDQKK
jgi:hypothetical protein